MMELLQYSLHDGGGVSLMYSGIARKARIFQLFETSYGYFCLAWQYAGGSEPGLPGWRCFKLSMIESAQGLGQEAGHPHWRPRCLPGPGEQWPQELDWTQIAQAYRAG